MMQTWKEHQTGVHPFGIFSKGRQVPGAQSWGAGDAGVHHPCSWRAGEGGVAVGEVHQKPGEAKDTEMSWWAVRASGEAGRGGGACHHMALREAGALTHTHTPPLLGFHLWATSPEGHPSGFQSPSPEPRGLCPGCRGQGQSSLHSLHLFSSSSWQTPPSFSSSSYKTRAPAHT